MQAGRLHGLNVTIPHKRRLFPWLAGQTDAARAIGAVNTVFLHQGQLWGENTDAAGFWDDLQAHGLAQGRRALVLGAGGAARAVAWVLQRHGWQVWVMARRPETAAALKRRFNLAGVLPWLGETPTVDLLVNATPVGMFPHGSASPWPPDRPLPAAAVYDLVYRPRPTRLLQLAAAQGRKAVDGWGMLQAQARRAFFLWTGCQPSLSLPLEEGLT